MTLNIQQDLKEGKPKFPKGLGKIVFLCPPPIGVAITGESLKVRFDFLPYFTSFFGNFRLQRVILLNGNDNFSF